MSNNDGRELTTEEREARRQGEWVQELTKLDGWKKVLKPWLEKNVENSWIDPREFTSDEELKYAYSLAWARAEAVREILNYIEKMIAQAEHYERVSKGEIEEPFEKYWRK